MEGGWNVLSRLSLRMFANAMGDVVVREKGEEKEVIYL